MKVIFAQRPVRVLLALFAFCWALTWLWGRAQMAGEIFTNKIYWRDAFADRSVYRLVDKNTKADPPYPFYTMTIWSPFPFMLVAKYGVLWGFTGGGGGTRLILWVFGWNKVVYEWDEWAS